MPEAARAGQRWVVVGSSVAALVLAERLGASGRAVTLVNPGSTWGGVFAGLRVGSRVFDAGMTNFEFELFGEPHDDLQMYDPDRQGDLVKYVHFVKTYVQRFATVHEVPAPEMIWRGQRYRDLMLTNDFQVLRSLPTAEREQIVRELDVILASPNPLHPRFKREVGSELARHSFEAVSIANHGVTFHRLFVEPLFQKVLGVSCRDVPGIFHRSGWAPLFYPETLASQFGPGPQVLKRTVFHYPDDAHFGAFIRRIADRVRTLPSARVLEGVGDVRVDPSHRVLRTERENLPFDQLGWAGDLRQLAAQLAPQSEKSLAPEFERASLELFLIQMRPQERGQRFSVLIDPALDSPFYRFTNQTVCGLREDAVQQVVLECNSKAWAAGPTDEAEHVAAALARAGLDPSGVIEMTHKTFAGALAIPSIAQRERFNVLRAAVQSTLPGVHLIGPSSGFTSVTLNDHIIQALKIAQREGAAI